MSQVAIQSAEVREWTRRFNDYRVALNHVMSLLAARLPSLHRELRELTQSFEGEGRGHSGGSLVAMLEEAKTVAGEFREAVDEAVGESKSAMAQIESSSERLRSLTDALAQVETVSSRIRLMALNASIVAASRGSAGRGFEVLTKQLRGISQAFRDEAASVRSLTSEIEKDLQRVSELQREVEESLHGILAASLASLDEQTDQIRGLIATLEGALQDAANGAGDISGQIGKVMVTIQREDILRQGMEHVALVVREVDIEARRSVEGTDEGRPAREVTALVAEAHGLRLASHLQTRIEEEVDELFTDVRAGLSSIKALASQLASLRERCGAEGEFEARLSEPVAAVGKAASQALSRIRSLGGFTDLFDGLTQTVERLRRGISNFDEMVAELRVTNSLMKIEIARVEVLAEASTLTEVIESTVNTFGAHVEDVRRSARAITASLVASREMLSETAAVRGDAVETLRDRLQYGLGALRGASAQYADKVAGISELCRVLDQSARGFEAQLGDIDGGLYSGGSLGKICGQLADRSQATFDVLPPRKKALADVDACIARLQQMVGRSAVLSHQLAGNEVVGGAVEQGDEEGTLTLF